MKKSIILLFCLLIFFLCACHTNKADENESKVIQENQMGKEGSLDEKMTSVADTTPSPTPTKDEKSAAYLKSLETISWTELECYVDEETSRHNSNFLNFGYLDYDAEGNIYYINKNDGCIYFSNSQGENKRLLSDRNAAEAMLQLEGEWLFYYNKGTKSIRRTNVVTGATEDVLVNGAYGQFVVTGNRIYTNDEGFCSFSLDGGNREVLPHTEDAKLCYYSQGDEFWICKSSHLSKQGYLVKYDGEKVQILDERGAFPLLAGNYLSIVNEKTEERHIYNLTTKQDINLKVKTEKAIVSDGIYFYYSEWEQKNSKRKVTLYRWDGTKTEEIQAIENEEINPIYHMFLTPEKLYYLTNGMKNEGAYYQLFYYDLETGETGQIY